MPPVTLARAAAVAALTLVLAAPATAQVDPPSPAAGLTPNGRKLDPAGRVTPVGTFPTGGALTPDGRFYWAVDAGRGDNAIRVVDVATGTVAQTLPIPGGYVGIAFAPDGRHAYVSGLRSDSDAGKGLPGADGDVVHVYNVDPRTGVAREGEPIALPQTGDGAAAGDELPPASGVAAWPEGLDVTSDGRYLVVALGQADGALILDLQTREGTLAPVGRYPYGVVTDPRRPVAYVTNERDGTVIAIEVPSGKTLATIEVGGDRGAAYAHPEGIVADPLRDRVYVAVTNRDLVAVIDTDTLALDRYVDVGRPEGIGTAPVALAVGRDADTLYVAGAGEDAVAAVALEQRPTGVPRPRLVVAPRAVSSIARYRRALATPRKRLRGAPRAKRATELRRRYLRGRRVRACGGANAKQDAVYGRAIVRALALRDAARRRGASKAQAKRALDARVARAR
ncbi:MAG: hypothetical protein QOJ12_3201, partial [Thermoleophilales bacterium]|nr:hypothetical protein [Thermoleophilales bacterium]